MRDLQLAYRWPRILVPITLLVLAAIGTQASFADSDGEQLIAYAPISAPIIMSMWWALEWLFAGEKTLPGLLRRILHACLTVQVPLILAI